MNVSFLDAFSKHIRKTTISFVMPVRLFACLSVCLSACCVQSQTWTLIPHAYIASPVSEAKCTLDKQVDHSDQVQGTPPPYAIAQTGKVGRSGHNTDLGYQIKHRITSILAKKSRGMNRLIKKGQRSNCIPTRTGRINSLKAHGKSL